MNQNLSVNFWVRLGVLDPREQYHIQQSPQNSEMLTNIFKDFGNPSSQIFNLSFAPVCYREQTMANNELMLRTVSSETDGVC